MDPRGPFDNCSPIKIATCVKDMYMKPTSPFCNITLIYMISNIREILFDKCSTFNEIIIACADNRVLCISNKYAEKIRRAVIVRIK